MTVGLAKNSVLFRTSLVVEQQVEHWLPVRLGTFRPADDDVVVEYQDGDRVDLMAYRSYGDPRLRWVIMWANGLQFPEVELYPGRKLILPSKARVQQEFVGGR